MVSKRFEICNHTCPHKRAQSGRRKEGHRDCYVYPVNGSACKNHAKNAKLHPECSIECPAFSGQTTRPLTNEDWVMWASAVSDIYPKLREQIPPQFQVQDDDSDVEIDNGVRGGSSSGGGATAQSTPYPGIFPVHPEKLVPDDKQYKYLVLKRFNFKVVLSTFACSLVVAYSAFADNLARNDMSRVNYAHGIPYNICMLFAFLSIACHAMGAVVSGRGAVLCSDPDLIGEKHHTEKEFK
ncbi:hypothetical protein M378DRAFT_199973, partial [Amanita muscaria Koide BX008]